LSEKRKDNKGRVLKDGESQRKDGRYMFRYSDLRGRRRCVYAKTLAELRDAESNIQNDLANGIDTAAGSMTVEELVDSYIGSKRNIRVSTESMYKSVASAIKNSAGCKKQIKNFTVSDARRMMCDLYDSGKSYSYIELMKKVLVSAFKQSVDDGYVRTNPFSFKLSDVLLDDSVQRKALTDVEKETFLCAAKEGLFGRRYYDEVFLLLHTGLRVSELYGLTVCDIDFDERCISVNKQLLYNGKLYIAKPKTKSGDRVIPIVDNDVLRVLQRIVMERRHTDVEWIIDGYTGFLFLNKSGVPKNASVLQHAMSEMIRRYNSSHTQKLPKVTPHILRHTYCTNMIANGVDPKTVQYLMGHGDISVTMNVYSHMDYERAKKALKRAISE